MSAPVTGAAVQPDRVVGRPAALGPGAAHPRPYQGRSNELTKRVP